MNAVARALGYRWFERSTLGRFELRFSWAEITGGLGFALGLSLFEEGYSIHIRLGWPNIYLKLRLPRAWVREPRDSVESWGFSWFWDSIHLHWGCHTRIIHLPWEWEWVRSSYLMPDGSSWSHVLRGWGRQGHLGTANVRKYFLASTELPQWSEPWLYHYVLRSGEVQNVDATIKVHEMEWRWRWFTWLPWPSMIRRYIDVRFSDEVGERAGSWKGGVLGCGYELRADETPYQCLRRMEYERKFT